MTYTEVDEILMLLNRLYRMERAEDLSTRRSEAAIAVVERWLTDHPSNTTQHTGE